MDTIFGKIIKRELPAEIVFENGRLIAIKDIHPIAPVHLLIIPKKEIPNIHSLTEIDKELIAEIFFIAQQLAEEFKIAEGYRLVTNNGSLGGQEIFHLHFHLIGGRALGKIG